MGPLLRRLLQLPFLLLLFHEANTAAAGSVAPKPVFTVSPDSQIYGSGRPKVADQGC
jgi:hypothetical protein